MSSSYGRIWISLNNHINPGNMILCFYAFVLQEFLYLFIIFQVIYFDPTIENGLSFPQSRFGIIVRLAV